ncbi:ribosomal RNA processing protein 36 homolog [Anabrus simplex]|uniref:ribosomal RNA processing protein 36 homolog n=1 Tax=Anabrus simplex TaxID=316456 RepID=UPI0035A335CC
MSCKRIATNEFHCYLMMENGIEKSERASIKEELANMSFEEMIKLKEHLGGKAYNEAVFGVRPTKTYFKRENKNRPREMSSKIRPGPFQDITHPKKIVRDPRFDPLCGKFDEKVFSSAYSFIGDIKKRELEQLRTLMKKETDEKQKTKIRYLITRMENQEREAARCHAKHERSKKEHEEQIEMLRNGEKPWFQKKSEKQLLDLVEQYHDLKKSGKLHKHIEKRRRRNARHDWKQLNTAL